MDGEDAAADASQEVMREAFLHHTRLIASEAAAGKGYRVSLDAIAAIGDVALAFSGVLARDAELFAMHAKRARICVDDVKLCARRNDSLLAQLTAFANELAAAKPPPSSKKPSPPKPATAAAAAPSPLMVHSAHSGSVVIDEDDEGD
jgi:centromere protein S